MLAELFQLLFTYVATDNKLSANLYVMERIHGIMQMYNVQCKTIHIYVTAKEQVVNGITGTY
jgi:hypothetical protein